MTYPWQVAVTLAAGCVMLALACIAQTQRKILVAKPFSAVCLLASVWCFLYGWQLQSSDLEEKIFILQLGFTLVPFAPVLSLETTYRFVYERRLFRGWLLLAVLVVPAITAVLGWTINSSPIFRYDCWVDTSSDLPLLRYTNGPWFFVFYAYSYGLAIWSFFVLFHNFSAADPWSRRARLLIFVARLIPIVFDVLFHFQVLPPVGMNYAPASVAIADILLSIIFFGDRFGYRAYIAHSKLVEKISDLLVVLDGRRRVLDINQAVTEMLGIRLKDVQGLPVERLFVDWPEMPLHPDANANGMIEVERNGEYFELSTIPILEAGEAGIHILWLRNITQRKKAELGYQAAAEAAREANFAKDRYLAVMSHEIRSPLNSVLGFMRLLEETKLDPRQREYITHVSRSGDNLLTVINEVLDFARIEAGGMQVTEAPFNVRDTITDLCDGMQIEARAKGLEFSCEIAADVPPVVMGDRIRVGQILRNLIGNAIKFTAHGSVTITVDGEMMDASPAECVLKIAVADTGIGIAEHEMAGLFQPFTQGSPSIQHRFGGTGLGLLIARRFSELMGGTITVESVPRHGSIFTCALRLRVGGVVEETARPAVAAATASYSILIVDDQQVNRRLLEIMLGRLHHRTECASDGFECLEMLRGKTFDVIFLDIEMPGINGFDVCRQIRLDRQTALRRPYIIALTAHASFDIKEQCLAAGMDGYLSKPLTALALGEALRAVSSPPEPLPGPGGRGEIGN